MAEQNRGRATANQFVINSRRGIQPVNRCEKNAIDAAREQAADDLFFAFGNVQRLRQDDIVSKLMGLFFNPHDDARVDGVGSGWYNQAKEL